MVRRPATALLAFALAIAVLVAGRGWVRESCASALTRDRIEGCRCCDQAPDEPRPEPGIAARCCDVTEAPALDPAPTVTTGPTPTLALTAPPARIAVGSPPPAPSATRIARIAPRAIGPPTYLEHCVLRL